MGMEGCSVYFFKLVNFERGNERVFFLKSHFFGCHAAENIRGASKILICWPSEPVGKNIKLDSEIIGIIKADFMEEKLYKIAIDSSRLPKKVAIIVFIQDYLVTIVTHLHISTWTEGFSLIRQLKEIKNRDVLFFFVFSQFLIENKL